MLSIPRSQLPAADNAVRRLAGARIPRSLPGRSALAQLLIELVRPAGPAPDPDLADMLRESITELIHARLGRSSGIGRRTQRALQLAHLRSVIQRRLNEPNLNVAGLAAATSMSTRSLHALCRDTGHTPMQLVKQLRLQAAHRSLQDPAHAAASITDIAAAHGYRRPDQFAHDFKRQFGVSATHVRARQTR
jgi:AraC-like DNA-binding protein